MRYLAQDTSINIHMHIHMDILSHTYSHPSLSLSLHIHIYLYIFILIHMYACMYFTRMIVRSVRSYLSWFRQARCLAAEAGCPWTGGSDDGHARVHPA